MELHQLRYLVAVADTHSFTHAAEQCHVTQPTLSHQIKKLEGEIGEPLLQRRKKGTFLTPLGERVYSHGREIMRNVEAIQQQASAFSQSVQGALRIGVIPTIAPYFLPDLMKRSQAKFPGIRFNINEEPTERLLASIGSGTLDLAVLSPPIANDRIATLDLLVEPFLLALPMDHALVKARNISLNALREYPMILMNDAHCLRGQTISFCRRVGFTPDVVIQSSQLDTVLAMVESGQGISLIPAMARNFFKHRKIIFRALNTADISRTISLAWSKQMNPSRAFHAFVEVCQAG